MLDRSSSSTIIRVSTWPVARFCGSIHLRSNSRSSPATSRWSSTGSSSKALTIFIACSPFGATISRPSLRHIWSRRYSDPSGSRNRSILGGGSARVCCSIQSIRPAGGTFMWRSFSASEKLLHPLLISCGTTNPSPRSLVASVLLLYGSDGIELPVRCDHPDSLPRVLVSSELPCVVCDRGVHGAAAVPLCPCDLSVCTRRTTSTKCCVTVSSYSRCCVFFRFRSRSALPIGVSAFRFVTALTSCISTSPSSTCCVHSVSPSGLRCSYTSSLGPRFIGGDGGGSSSGDGGRARVCAGALRVRSYRSLPPLPPPRPRSRSSWFIRTIVAYDGSCRSASALTSGGAAVIIRCSAATAARSARSAAVVSCSSSPSFRSGVGVSIGGPLGRWFAVCVVRSLAVGSTRASEFTRSACSPVSRRVVDSRVGGVVFGCVRCSIVCAVVALSATVLASFPISSSLSPTPRFTALGCAGTVSSCRFTGASEFTRSVCCPDSRRSVDSRIGGVGRICCGVVFSVAAFSVSIMAVAFSLSLTPRFSALDRAGSVSLRRFGGYMGCRSSLRSRTVFAAVLPVVLSVNTLRLLSIACPTAVGGVRGSA